MATIRPYDPADLGRVLALWDGHVDVDDALQVISSANGVALVAEVEGALGGIALGAFAGTEGRIVTVTAADGELETRPPLSEEIVASFDDDVREFARD